jgi:hypothetical protein
MLRLTLALAAGCTMLIMAFCGIGSVQSPPASHALLAELHLADCALPCWLGITPGITRFAEAVYLVSRANPGLLSTSRNGISVIAWYPIKTSWIPVILRADESGKVVQLTLVTANIEGISIGDVVGFLGLPACRDKFGIAVYVSHTAFAQVIPDHYRGWHTPLNKIDIRSMVEDEHPCAIPAN